jgi:hypothetical protein
MWLDGFNMTHMHLMRARLPGLPRRHVCLALAWPAAACAQAPGVDALAAQWRTLRTQPGHFDDARWNDDVDRWQGRKHQVMQALAQRAREQAASQTLLTQWMGAPDAQWSRGQREHGQALEQAQWQGTPQGDLLVYNWRARRDRLVFAVHEGKVVATAWLHDFE